MSERSTIEWTDASWNPVTGCTKVSQGCKNCYAERITERFGQKFTDIKLHPDRIELPLLWRKPRRIFVNSMSDLFHEEIPLAFLESVWRIMVLAHRHRRHTFQVLTKRPANMLKALGPNGFGWYKLEGPVPCPEAGIWLGVSVENQETADERIPLLLQTPAAVRFVSYEPALGPLDLSKFVHVPQKEKAFRPVEGECSRCGLYHDESNSGLDWLIAGGESGAHARPGHPDWFRQVRDQCQAADVAFFFKQRGEWTWDRPDNYVRISKYRYSHETFAWDAKGKVYNPLNPPVDHFPSVLVWRVGKKRAGRMLDGREWNEYPSAKLRSNLQSRR